MCNTFSKNCIFNFTNVYPKIQNGGRGLIGLVEFIRKLHSTWDLWYNYF